ncbi:protein lifeguard 2-like isoform X1 [Ostrinia nubilalis]|uniref:protein lifeguard 2-like isoform X1 n=1 Tax=Ostrinia nubilalis TaxID=29057 RepID=UPI003082443A
MKIEEILALSKEIHKDAIPSDNIQTQYIVINMFKQQNEPEDTNPRAHDGKVLPAYRPGTLTVFIQCIMLMTFTMFMFTGILVGYIMITPDVKQFIAKEAIFMIALFLFIFLFIDYGFVCTDCSRRVPCNFYFLCLTVVSLSVIIATVSALCDSSVLLCTILAVAVTVLIAVFLTFTKTDFSSPFMYAVMLVTAFFAVILIAVILIATKTYVNPLWLLGVIIATFIQVTMLTMQLQTILGGRTIELKEDDYAIASFMLYASVIDVFLKMLQIADVTRDAR